MFGLLFFFFFFQAEDGIRDYKVTGVQTCALPISFRGGGCVNTDMVARPYRASPAKGTGLTRVARRAPTTAACCAQSRMRAYYWRCQNAAGRGRAAKLRLSLSAALSGLGLRRLQRALGRLIF